MARESIEPNISVVMSVYNEENNLENTLLSVLDQNHSCFEVIVINDGSTDGSGKILDCWAAKDTRLRVVHQENSGLTKALIQGCALAKGQYIARQDAGDISLPNRIDRQYEYLCNNPDAVMVSGSTCFVGPNNERLFDVIKEGIEIEIGLAKLNVNTIQGPPHHGSTMFRKDAYDRVGGYRAIFTVAQDIDLWLRLSEVGRCMGLVDILYQARLSAGGISSLRRSEQYALGSLAIKCAEYRRSGKDESSLLESYQPHKQIPSKATAYKEKAIFYYFIASCLKEANLFGALLYYAQFIRHYLLLIMTSPQVIWIGRDFIES